MRLPEQFVGKTYYLSGNNFVHLTTKRGAATLLAADHLVIHQSTHVATRDFQLLLSIVEPLRSFLVLVDL